MNLKIIEKCMNSTSCFRHNFTYTRGWMEINFYCHMIYSPETDRHSKTRFLITISRVQQIVAHDIHNDTYPVHKGALVLCQTRPPCLLTSCRHLTSSTVWCQLFVFFPAWRAGPPIFPLSQDGPASPRVHAHLCPIVRVPYHGGGRRK